MIASRFERTILLLFLTILGGAWISFSRESSSTTEGSVLAEAPIVGHLAPDFTLQTAIGESVSLTDHVDRSGDQGRPVVLNYWASWCGPCRVETPELQDASLKYKNRVAIIGVNQGETPATITKFGTSFGLNYPLLVDENNVVNQLYGVVGLPTTVFIDRKGIVREVFVGILSQATLQERIERLLAD